MKGPHPAATGTKTKLNSLPLNGYKKKYVFLFQILLNTSVCPRLPVRDDDFFFIRVQISKRMNEPFRILKSISEWKTNALDRYQQFIIVLG